MKYRLNVNVSIENADYSGGRLEVRETLTVTAHDFMGVAKILGQFHDLTENLNAAAEEE